MYYVITGVTETDDLWERVRRKWSSLPTNMVLSHSYSMIGRLCAVDDFSISDWLGWLGSVCSVGLAMSVPSK